jgi:hypothetical protein
VRQVEFLRPFFYSCLLPFCSRLSIVKAEAIFIVGAAIAESLFLLYLDMMFRTSSFNAQNTGGAPTTTIAGDFGGVTGNSTNRTGAPYARYVIMLSLGETCARLPCLQTSRLGTRQSHLYRIVYPVVAAIDVVYPQSVLVYLLKVINLLCGCLVRPLRGRHKLAVPIQHHIISNSLDRPVRDSVANIDIKGVMEVV